MTVKLSISNSAARLTPLAACLGIALAAGTTSAGAAPHPIPLSRHALLYARGQALPSVAQRRQKFHAIEQAFRATHPHVAPVPGHVAATLPVTNCNDSGAGSFRDAVTTAGNGDTVDLSALPCSTITLTTGAVATGVDNLTIVGPGQGALTIDANYNDRAIAHFGYGTLSISGVTVANGDYYNYGYAAGGCVFTSGSLTLTQSTVTNCYVASYYASLGGGVYANSGATIANCTISNNTQGYGYGYASGGGIAAYSGTITVTDSTVSGNSTAGNAGRYVEGAGVYNFGGNVAIVGSTLSNNYAGGAGGGVSNWYGTLTLTNSTITGNASFGAGGGASSFLGTVVLNNSTISTNSTGYFGGGVYDASDSGTSAFNSTIIFGNAAGQSGNDTNAYPAAAVTGANNLIGSSDGTLTAPGDTISSDPLLQALANNGGPTMTQALGTGSPAIDAGNNVAGLSFDQRGAGFPRVSGAAADIGAFEITPPMAVPALSAWMLGLLTGLLAIIGWRRGSPAVVMHRRE